MVTRNLYTEPFVVLMPADHPLAQFKTVKEQDLSEYNVLLLGEGHCFRDQVISSCPTCFSVDKAHAGVNWRTVERGSLETIRHMVASGMGLTILPMTAARTSPYPSDILTYRPLSGVQPSRIVALAWRNSFPRIKAIEAVLESVYLSPLEGVNK